MSNELLGRPIKGEIEHYSSKTWAKQHPPEEFIEALDTLLDTPLVSKVRWEQYTPYFNDGDACEFGLGEFYVWVDGASRDPDEDFENEEVPDGWDYGEMEDGFLSSGDLFKWGEGIDWKEMKANGKYEVNGVATKEIADALDSFVSIVRHHEVMMRDKFGDPSQVTATKEGFEVEFYDHE